MERDGDLHLFHHLQEDESHHGGGIFMTSSKPNHVPKTSLPHTIPWRGRASTYDFGGDTIQSIAYILSKFWFKVRIATSCRNMEKQQLIYGKMPRHPSGHMALDSNGLLPILRSIPPLCSKHIRGRYKCS